MACFNSEKTIEQALYSVVNQTYNKMEFILIDGGSKDQTLEIIKKYRSKIAFYSSERDEGVYDAMNKGIQAAKGKYLYFLGSDDCLVKPQSIEEIANFLEDRPEIDLLCAPVWGIDERLSGMQKLMGKELLKEEILSGEMAPHQGMFIKQTLLKESGYNTKYKIAADYDFFLRMCLLGKQIVYLNSPVAYYNLDGQSSQAANCFEEYVRILRSYGIEDFYIKQLIQKKMKHRWFKECIKNSIQFLRIGKWVQSLRGFQKHCCDLPYCRWCKRKKI